MDSFGSSWSFTFAVATQQAIDLVGLQEPEGQTRSPSHLAFAALVACPPDYKRSRTSVKITAWRYARYVRASPNSAVRWVFSRRRASPSAPLAGRVEKSLAC